ncbi:MAG: tRNA 2-selenouridine(34) synthase MnmH [Chitinophagaceae bacterium]|nr:tRNA 2-selenouridine(34) synthase MnmH [Chitinophagaceae bacterium]
MAIKKIPIQEFLQLSKEQPVLDVRSPGEFLQAHIPGAVSLPLFTDEERKVVGTTYKQKSREAAIKIGLDYFGVKMRKMVEETEEIVSGIKAKGDRQTIDCNPDSYREPTVLVHCWRGGMRSAGVAWLLDLYGFKVYTLVGGYKAYRHWVRQQFDHSYNFGIIGGYTGSGKTLVLKELQRLGKPVIDLEALACHKGSAFGAFGEAEQPRQEMFENLLAKELSRYAGENMNGERIFVEDESHRIGNLNIPLNLWTHMRNCPVYFLDIPFEQRLDYITVEYGKFEKEKLVNAIIRIQKRLGGQETKNAINFLIEGDVKECFRILLKYYDKWYSKGLHNRENLSALLNKIPSAGVDTVSNAQNIVNATSLAEKTF